MKFENASRRAFAARSAVIDFFVGWWRAAFGPLRISQHRTRTRAILHRILIWMPVAVLLAAFLGAAGFYFFVGWRARDLASKARVNVAEGRVHTARLQAYSARGLRADDPAVLLASAVVETKAGSPAAIGLWEGLPADIALGKEELVARAEAMARAGSAEQLAAALSALEVSGFAGEAARLRMERSWSRGDMESALAVAREVAKDGDAETRLLLLRLLAARFGPLLADPATATPADLLAGAEMTQLVDSLLDTPQAADAMLTALAVRLPDEGRARVWCEAIWQDGTANNPALLPAATRLVRDGHLALDEARLRLKAVYAGAGSDQRAALAGWHLQQGDAEGALEAATAKNAANSTRAFLARAGALAVLERHDELLTLGEAGSSAPSSLQAAIRAKALRSLGRVQKSDQAMRDALRASAMEGTVGQVVEMADAMGASHIADEEILGFCAQPPTADGGFRLARDRFDRRGQFASLRAARDKALAASPGSAAALDYTRFEQLLDGREIDAAETAEAVAAQPGEVGPRFTHALALLRADRAAEALAVFDDFDVIVRDLPPSPRAVAIAVLAANGHASAAAGLAAGLDRRLLSPGAWALIAPQIR